MSLTVFPSLTGPLLPGDGQSGRREQPQAEADSQYQHGKVLFKRTNSLRTPERQLTQVKKKGYFEIVIEKYV